MSRAEHEEFAPRVEEDTISRRVLWGAAAFAVVVVIVSFLVADRLLHFWARGRTPLYAAQPPSARPQIGIVEQTSILDTQRGLEEKARQRESLRHYEWLDIGHRMARLPIDRAMDLAADRDFVRRAFAQDGGR
jgi:hypothetical protein